MADLLKRTVTVVTGAVSSVPLARADAVKTINGVVPSSASATSKRKPITAVEVYPVAGGAAGNEVFFTVDGSTPTLGNNSDYAGAHVARIGTRKVIAISAPASSVSVKMTAPSGNTGTTTVTVSAL
jgi:uncharacterized protein (UPF0210 family)